MVNFDYQCDTLISPGLPDEVQVLCKVQNIDYIDVLAMYFICLINNYFP